MSEKVSLYEPYHLVKNLNSRLKSHKPESDGKKYKYDVLNYREFVSIDEDTGELYFGRDLNIDDYMIYIKRTDLETEKILLCPFILFVRDSDDIDENNCLIEK